jgi:glyoxylase-like metal-dependent hydrolase (beta-lactamase superfamily II)
MDPRQLRPNRRCRSGTVFRIIRRHGDGSLVLLPTSGHTAGSISLLVRRRTLPPLLIVGDLTYDAALLERRQLPGVGDRGQLSKTTDKVLALTEHLPGLVMLPAHDPTAAERLLDSSGGQLK